jgi:hypothetical protein
MLKRKSAKRLHFEALEPRLVLAADHVVINEILPHPTFDADPDWIELYNTETYDVQLDGWYISDTSNYRLYQIPANTTVPAKGFVTFNQTQYGGVMGFEEEWNTVRLIKPDGTTVADVRTYGPPDGETPPTGLLYGVAHNVTFGRYKNSDGNTEFVALSTPTPGGPNAYPLTGSVVINEIMYHPSSQNPPPPAGVMIDEYIELYNRGPGTAALYDPSDLTPDPWRFTNGVTYAFDRNPAGVYLNAGQYALVVGISPSVFRSRYAVPANVQIFGPWSSGDNLDNAGERVTLMMPETGTHDTPQAPYYFNDSVLYDDASPWPEPPDDGSGRYSLCRLGFGLWGDNWTSWGSAAPTPGAANAAITPRTVGRYVFYNNSAFDTGGTAGDDAAIATDKDALLPGKTADFDNYTGYDRGINGTMVDIVGLSTANPVPANFQVVCQIGNPPTAAWTNAPAPTVTVRAGGGVGGTCRLVLTWPDGAIKNTWLKASISAAAIGMTTADVFYFGNAIGECHTSNNNAVVSSADENEVRSKKTGFSMAAITNDHDFNRDRFVDSIDELIARGNYSNAVTNPALNLIAAAAAAAAGAAVPTTPTSSTRSVQRATASPVLVSSPAKTAKRAPVALTPAKAAEAGGTVRAWLRLLDLVSRTKRPANRQTLIAQAADRVFAAVPAQSHRGAR